MGDVAERAAGIVDPPCASPEGIANDFVAGEHPALNSTPAAAHAISLRFIRLLSRTRLGLGSPVMVPLRTSRFFLAPRCRVVVYREPGAAWYASVRSYGPGESIAPIAFPDAELAVRDLLPSQQ